MMRLDAHNYRRRIELFFERVEKNESMPEEDKETLKRYKDYLVSEGITFGRVAKYLYDLNKASELLMKGFGDADEQDIRRIVSIVDKNEKYSPWTKRDFKVAIRKFYTWLRGTKGYPPEVAWLRVHVKIRNATTHEDILTEEEVKKLIEFARTVQEKAFISTLYESGCRIGELIYIKISQVKFDDYGAQHYVTGKTGFRRVRVISSVPYLVEWLNKHPFKDDPEAYVWLTNWLKPFGYSGITQMLYRTARKAGIWKRVNPHNFRHSRATYLANFLTEVQMKEFFGWTQDSRMASVYIHLCGRDVDNAPLKVYGIQTGEEKKESIFKPKDCSRCQQVNEATNKFCSRCGFPLDEETRAEVIRKSIERKEANNIMDRLLEDQEFREMFLRKVEMMRFSEPGKS
jgi:integrase/ribosomal protein L37E